MKELDQPDLGEVELPDAVPAFAELDKPFAVEQGTQKRQVREIPRAQRSYGVRVFAHPGGDRRVHGRSCPLVRRQRELSVRQQAGEVLGGARRRRVR